MPISSDGGFSIIVWVCFMLTIFLQEIIKPEDYLNGQQCGFHQGASSNKLPVFFVDGSNKT
jgi:hypothetical protein